MRFHPPSECLNLIDLCLHYSVQKSVVAVIKSDKFIVLADSIIRVYQTHIVIQKLNSVGNSRVTNTYVLKSLPIVGISDHGQR